MPSVQFTSLGGFDYGPIIDQLVNLKRIPIKKLEGDISDYSTKGKLVDQLISKLNGLRDVSDSLKTMDDFLSYAATSSDESTLTVSSTGVSQETSFTVEVNSLASSSKLYSTPQAAKDTPGLYGVGTMDILVGGAVVGTVNVDATSTMESIVSDINALNQEVKASVFYDGSAYRILAVGTKTGAANDVTFAEMGSTIGLDTATTPYREAATDATITVDGSFTVSSEENTFSGVIQGLTLDVEKTTATGESVTVSVAPDADTTADKVQDLLDHYNSIAAFLNYQLSYTGTVKGKDTLFGDTSARGVQSRLSSLVTSTIPGLPNTMSALSMIGVKTERDGTLSFDKAAFKEKLAEDSEGVASLFVENDALGTQGIACRFTEAIEGFVDPSDGSLVAKKEGIQRTITRLEETIDGMELRLEKYEAMLYKQYEAMTTAVSNLNYQASYLTGLSSGTNPQ